ncbi:MAG: hypothetical protein CSA42_08395, partial [Gammaproteobacteria bacterium]
MNWFVSIDLYCERTCLGFWAEPLNALSNIAFFIAGFSGLYTAIKFKKNDSAVLTLCVLSILIGIGSFLFHTFANLWSSFADVIPIWSFVALYIVTVIIKLTGKSFFKVGGIAITVTAIIISIVWIMSSGSATQTEPSSDMLNGSIQYLPALIAIWYFAIASWKKKIDIHNWFIASAITFMLSLVFRTIDLHVCNFFPFGTHFLWHICNGIMIA